MEYHVPPGVEPPDLSSMLEDHGVAAWRFNDPSSSDEGIVVWEEGATRLLTEWGHSVHINDAGQMAIARFHSRNGSWQVWTYRDGEFFKVTRGPSWSVSAIINSLGELVFQSDALGSADIVYMRRFALGDLNCDGAIDAADIEGFLLALFDPAEFANQYPACDATLADINRDGSVDALDIEPFIGLLFP